MQKVKTRGDHRAFCFHATSGPGGFPGPLVFACWLICAWLASAAGTVRSDDRPTVRRYDALRDGGRVGAIGVVLITTAPTIVAIPRADAEAERADSHATPSSVRDPTDLRGGRNRRNEQGTGCHGQ